MDALPPELIRALNVLGHEVSVPFQSGTSLSSATTGALPAAPSPGAQPTQASIQGQGGNAQVAGQGLPTDAIQSLLKNLLGQSPETPPTRGQTGGVSLSDQLRSSGGGVAGAAGPTGGTTLPGGGSEVITPGEIPGTGVSGQEAGGVSFDFGPGAAGAAASALGSQLGQTAAEATAFNAAQGAGTSSAGALEALGPAAAESGSGAAGGLIAGGLAAIPGIWMGINDFLQSQAHAAAQAHETSGIRRDFPAAWSTLGGAPEALAALQAGGDPAAARDAAFAEMAAQGPVSQFISTQGGRQTRGQGLHIPAVDVSGLEAQTPTLVMDSLLNYLLSSDKLGAPAPGSFYEGRTPADNPLWYLSGLSTAAGLPAEHYGPRPAPIADPTVFGGQVDPTAGQAWYTPTAEQMAQLSTPGDTTQAILSIFGQLNPDFASSMLGQTMAGFGQPAAANAAGGGGDAAAQTAALAALPSPAGDVAGAAGSPGGTTDEEQLKKALQG